MIHANSQGATPKKTANILAVTGQTLSVWCCTKRHSIKYVKIGSKVFYRENDIQAFIESCVYGGNKCEQK